MKQETRVFICEKCKNEFPGVGRLKKHIRKVHDVRNLALEENSEFAAFAIFSRIVKSVNTNFLA